MVYLEIINCILTIISVYLLAKDNRYGWILSIVVCITMGYIYVEEKLWYQGTIQIIFLLQSILAYFKWSEWVEKKIMNMSINTVMLFYFLTTSFFLYSIEHKWLSFLDLFLMFISFIATHLLIIKNKYSWYLWLFYDIISILLCIYLKLYVTVGLFFVLGIICINKLRSYEKI